MTTLSAMLGALMAILQSHPLCEQTAFGYMDYAYQLFKEDRPILRWDNKEEFRSLKTYPHYHHDEWGKIQSSLLAGEP